MSSHNTENETSNQIAPSIYCRLLFRSPLEPQFSRPSATQIVTFRVSPNPNDKHNPNHNSPTSWRAHQVPSAISVAKAATQWMVWMGT